MKIGFDKRLELIYGLVYCVDKDMNHTLLPGLFVEELPTYCREFYELYRENISKDLFQYIKDYGMNGDWNQPAIIALSMDENYNIVNNDFLFNQVVMKNKNFDRVKLEKVLKEFVLKSNYDNFFDKHTNFYNKIVNSYKESMSKYKEFDENFILDFYGYRLGNLSIKLYNFTSGSQGLLIGQNQYYVQRVDNIGKDENNFIFKPKLITLIHEFSHPYINPLVDKYLKNISFSSIYQETKEFGLPKAYTELTTENNYQILKEYLVRTISIYLGSQYLDEQQIKIEIKKQMDNGFVRICEFVKLFEDKKNYSNFESFFKEKIVNYCLTLSDINKNISTKK